MPSNFKMTDPFEPTPYDEIIYQASRKYGLPVNFIKTVMMKESHGDPQAVSPAGAQGLMQIMPGTQKELGITDPFDPQQNIMGGAQYLAPLYQQHGPIGAWGAYNMGPSGYADALAGNRPIPQETVQGMNWIQQRLQPQKFGGSIPPAQGGMGQQPMQANTMEYRDPFDPYANLQLPGQPIYGQQPTLGQGPVQPPGGNPMGGAERGAPNFQFQPPAGAQPASPSGAASPAEAGQAQTGQAQGPQGPEGPGVQAQPGQYEPPAGTMNIPTPEQQPGFWETLRQAAQSDPATFYMVLADLATLNLNGIKQTIMAREDRMTKLAIARADAGQKEDAYARKRIDEARWRAAKEGVYDEEAIQSEEDVDKFYRKISESQKEENIRQADAQADRAFAALMKRLPSTGKFSKGEIDLIKRKFGEDADEVIANMERIAKEDREYRTSVFQMKEERLKLSEEAFRLAKERAASAQEKWQISQDRANWQDALNTIEKLSPEVHKLRQFSQFTDLKDAELADIEEKLKRATQEEQRLRELYNFGLGTVRPESLGGEGEGTTPPPQPDGTLPQPPSSPKAEISEEDQALLDAMRRWGVLDKGKK